MADFSDKEIEDLLQTLSSPDVPDVPDGLATRIVTALPERRAPWSQRLAAFFGADTLMVPAGGAFTALMIGVMTGYWLMLVDTPIADTADIYLAETFGDDPWGAFDTDTEAFQ